MNRSCAMNATCQRCHYRKACSFMPEGSLCQDDTFKHFRDLSLGPQYVPIEKTVSISFGRQFFSQGDRCRFRHGTEGEWEHGVTVHHSRDGRTWVLSDDVVCEAPYVEVEVSAPERLKENK
jgi:hypothetical protein